MPCDTTSYAKDTDATPVDVYVQTHTYWDSTAGILWQYVRRFSFDALGQLYSIGGEERTAVDSATNCGS